MSYVGIDGTEWEQGLGASFTTAPRGGNMTLAQTPASSRAKLALDANEGKAARKTSKFGSKPISKVLEIYRPKMDVIRDAATFAIEFMGPVAATKIGQLSFKDLTPVQSSDSRYEPAIRSQIQDLRAAAVFSILANAPAGVGTGPLAFGLAKALWKRGKWPQAKLNDVASRANAAFKSTAQTIAETGQRIVAGAKQFFSGLGDATGDDLSSASAEAGTQQQVQSGKEAAIITPEMINAILEIIKVGLPLAGEGAKQASEAVQTAPPPGIPGMPGQQQQAQAPPVDEGFPILPLLGVAIVGYFAWKR